MVIVVVQKMPDILLNTRGSTANQYFPLLQMLCVCLKKKQGKTSIKLDDLFLFSLKNGFEIEWLLQKYLSQHPTPCCIVPQYLVEIISVYFYQYFCLYLSPLGTRMALICFCPHVAMSPNVRIVHLEPGIFYHSITKMPPYLMAFVRMMTVVGWFGYKAKANTEHNLQKMEDALIKQILKAVFRATAHQDWPAETSGPSDLPL